jgi:hypothetical protein
MVKAMKKLKITIAFGLVLLLGACDVEYYDNPNAPSSAPTDALFNNNVKRMVDQIYDMWWSGRFTYPLVQYWHQTEYVEEDRYQFRETQRQIFNNFYEIAENYREIIRLNTEEATMDAAASSGANVNQVAQCRILLAYLFDVMASAWGDIPYWSYGSDDAEFQALNLSGVDEQIVTPVYAPQDKIFADILNELSEAADQLDESLPGIGGDNIYHGDVALWKKFANSLRLRIALKISGVNSSLGSQHISAALAGGVFESNDDNAMFKYEGNDANANMSYRAWYVGNRSDFAVGLSFVNLLKGENLVGWDHVTVTSKGPNPFLGIVDPRLPIYAQPNGDGDYVGMYVGEGSGDQAAFVYESLPGTAIIATPDYAETLMEYAEVAFIQSELNGWDQTEYTNGITASMQKWGVDQADIDAYLGAVPAASEENVLTQKYIALYMQGSTSWAEYRRTGYPHTLMQPFSETSVYVPSTDTWVDKEFNPIPDLTDVPYRMMYPQQEQTLNGDNRKAAADKLSNGDTQSSKLWWDVN